MVRKTGTPCFLARRFTTFTTTFRYHTQKTRQLKTKMGISAASFFLVDDRDADRSIEPNLSAQSTTKSADRPRWTSR